MRISVITISIDPDIELGPITVAWHGLMIAVGILVGLWLALRFARERKLSRDLVTRAALWMAVAGLVGSRFYYLVENDPGAVLRPGDWVSSNGFAFYGAVLSGVPAAWLALRETAVKVRYLDALAAGFPLGMAVGRVGDLILGEHYGRPTELPWGVAYTDPDAAVPRTGVAYESGALYEIVAAAVIFALIWPLRHRFQRPGVLLCTVVALYAAARFALFFVVRDADVVAFGLRQAQLTSLALLVVAAAALITIRHGGRRRFRVIPRRGQAID
jgi:phosphatidylglycerol:prolipoprotein diacylglycerol transferase